MVVEGAYQSATAWVVVKTYLFNKNSASTFVVPLLRIRLMQKHEFEVAVRACGNEDDDDAGDGARMQRDGAVAHHDGCEWRKAR